jgi:hypothetical protein
VERNKLDYMVRKSEKPLLDRNRRQILASYLMYIVTILNSFITLILILKINSLKPVESNFYPNNLYILFYQLICPLQVAGLGAWAYYRKHGNLISSLFSEVKDNIRFKYFQKIK